MKFNEHSQLQGLHAYLGASKYHWLGYNDEKLADSYQNHLGKIKGVELHAFAAEAIRLGIKLKNSKNTINLYVNDAIGFNMKSEVLLYYSDNCFGTADAISFRKNILRIHDLKTGITPASMSQLIIYAALFCLEYDKKPTDIDIELRIYQSNTIVSYIPENKEIENVIDKIIKADKIIDEVKLDNFL